MLDRNPQLRHAKGAKTLRKFRNLVIGGIETKIVNLILFTVILLTVAFAAVTMSQSKMLSSLTTETSKRQQDTTSGIISETMTKVTRSSMERTTSMEAQIVDELFRDINARVTLVSDYASKIFADPDLKWLVDEERAEYRDMLLRRGKAFEAAAKECGLEMVPFDAGFFASIPMPNPDEVAQELEKENIFLVPLAKGIRVSVASVSEEKCRLIPARIKAVMERLAK